MAKVDFQDDGCWQWTSIVKTGGYAYFTFGMDGFRASRVIYAWTHPGVEMAGLEIDHLCKNRLCVNPAHLELVTHRENWLRSDAPSVANATKTHCVHGHPFDAVNTGTQWNKRDRAMMRYCKECRRLGVLRRKATQTG